MYSKEDWAASSRFVILSAAKDLLSVCVISTFTLHYGQ
jgi:hypothetical protein